GDKREKTDVAGRKWHYVQKNQADSQHKTTHAKTSRILFAVIVHRLVSDNKRLKKLGTFTVRAKNNTI
ncbi:MAG TPA: hypothetical protein DCG57_16635, partial [Candidatus Riflebacteria bacterium]|nr:hypothetical protein [Candidatus Riflebacteria bacterium]